MNIKKKLKIKKIKFWNSLLFGPFYVKNSNSYILMLSHFSERYLQKEFIKKNFIKKRWTINNFYSIILFDTFFVTDYQWKKKYQLCRGPSNEHSYPVYFQLAKWFQIRRLTCKSLRTMTTDYESQWQTQSDEILSYILSLSNYAPLNKARLIDCYLMSSEQYISYIQWVNDYCFMSTRQFFSYIVTRTS